LKAVTAAAENLRNQVVVMLQMEEPLPTLEVRGASAAVTDDPFLAMVQK